MHVTNVRVSFLREKQPAQYEKAAPAVEFSAVLDDDEDHAVVARKLMVDATAVVYAGIGYDVPAKVATALASGVVPAEVSVEAKSTEVADRAPLTAEKATADGSDVPAEEAEEVAVETPAPKKRGRPKGSKNTRPKAGTAAAKKAAAAPSTTAADIPGDDDIPGDSPRVGPDDDPADHGVEAKEFTAKDLHTMIIDLINEKKLSVPSAKQLLAHFQVARAQDLTAEQVVEGKAMIEKMVEANS